jgi:hypothetical protein
MMWSMSTAHFHLSVSFLVGLNTPDGSGGSGRQKKKKGKYYTGSTFVDF